MREGQMKLNKLLTTGEIAKRFGIAEQTVNAWRNQGMPCVKLGKIILIRETSFLKWIGELEKKQNPENA